MRRFALILPLVALVACQQEAPKAATASDAWVRLPAVAGRPGAAYFKLHGGPVGDRVMAVSSPQAIKAEMHDMTMANGIMKMTAIEGGLDLPAGKEIAFAPESRHVMLYDISPQMTPGKKMVLKFTLASGGVIETQADLVAAGGEEPHAH